MLLCRNFSFRVSYLSLTYCGKNKITLLLCVVLKENWLHAKLFKEKNQLVATQAVRELTV